LGDVDFFRITALMNGGTKDSAKIISQDNNFPSNDTAIKIVTFPALNYLDIDNDGVNELIATPFEDVYHKPSGKNQIWLYENSGTSILPIFHLVKKNFLQETMVDVGEGATPTVVDVDRDGLMDIIIGNYGDVDSVYYDTLWNNLYTYKNASLTYYRNIGTSTNPKFKLITNDWQGLKSYKYSAIKPTFGDLDFDGDQDLIIGNEKGTLSYFQNIAATNSPISLSSPIDFYQGIDSSYFAAPQLFDMNHDSLLDLVIGNKLGLISYYKNTGTKTLPAFTLVTDTLGKVHTNDYWNFNYANSYPNFYKDERDTFCLMAGSAAGYVFYYNRIESNLSGEFLKDSLQKFYRYWDTIRYDSVFSAVFWQSSYNSLHFIDEGMRTCPVLYDFNNDGYLDLLIGNFAGGISFYNGMKPLHIGINHIKIDQENFKLFPNPTTDYVNLELNNYADFNEMEIQIYETSGKLIKSIKCVPSQQINIPLTEFGNRSVLFIKIEAKDHEGKMHFATKKLIRY
jgi:hypothetical protein